MGATSVIMGPLRQELVQLGYTRFGTRVGNDCSWLWNWTLFSHPEIEFLKRASLARYLYSRETLSEAACLEV
jgi:hypothetical protein